MIEFRFENEFELENLTEYEHWIEAVISSEGKICGDITYTFCGDVFLDKLNRHYLDHEDYTDIISFDDSIGAIISGEIFISTDRVEENAQKYGLPFSEELLRVMAHGLLHYCGYQDKSVSDKKEMRKKEDEKMELFHVEQS